MSVPARRRGARLARRARRDPAPLAQQSLRGSLLLAAIGGALGAAGIGIRIVSGANIQSVGICRESQAVDRSTKRVLAEAPTPQRRVRPARPPAPRAGALPTQHSPEHVRTSPVSSYDESLAFEVAGWQGCRYTRPGWEPCSWDCSLSRQRELSRKTQADSAGEETQDGTASRGSRGH